MNRVLTVAAAFGAFGLALLASPVGAASPRATDARASVCVVSSVAKGMPDATVQYYKNGWQSLGATGADGCVSSPSLTGSLAVGVTLGGIYAQSTNDFTAAPKLTLKTVNTTVKLVDSNGSGLAGGTGQYSANGWQQLGTTGKDGTVSAELLPGNISFGMTYAGVYNQVTQANEKAPVVTFQTVKTTVQLLDSSKEPLAGGAVQYYANGGHDMGTTGKDGTVSAEVLPGSIPFGITFGGIYNQVTQSNDKDPVVTFQTVKTTVQLLDSSKEPLSGGGVQYYGNGWHEMGTSGKDGTVSGELLPGSIPFGITFGGIYNQVTQSNDKDPVVTFQTVKTTVQLLDSGKEPLAEGEVQFYGNGWQQLGRTGKDGTVSAELLPGSIPFGMTFGGIYNQVTQSNDKDPVVTFQTVKTTVSVIGSNGRAVVSSAVQYYANGWHSMGSTGKDGTVVGELLPGTIPFAAQSGSDSVQDNQAISTDQPWATLKLDVDGTGLILAVPKPASIVLEFVSATRDVVTWRIRAIGSGAVAVWGVTANSCKASGAASCDALLKDGAAHFFGKGDKETQLLITQPYKAQGESCTVENTLVYGPTELESNPRKVSASYKCSGAPTLGWPLLAVFALIGTSGAWWVHRRSQSWPKP